MATSMPILGTTGSLLVQAPVLRSIVAIRGVDTDKPLDVLEARQRATHKRIKPGLIRIVHGAVHCGEWGELYACPDAVAHVSIVIKLSTVDRKPVFLIDRLADMPRDDTHWIMEVSFFGSEPPNPISLKIKARVGPSVKSIFTSGPMRAHNQVIQHAFGADVEIEKAMQFVELEVEVNEHERE